MKTQEVNLKASSDVVTARQKCREFARELGFGSADQTRLATAVSELARNVIQYAGEGICVVSDQSSVVANVVCVTVSDNGPGIVDLDEAMTPGFTTKNGLGAGLPAAKRLVHEFGIQSEPGSTIVTIVMRCKKN